MNFFVCVFLAGKVGTELEPFLRVYSPLHFLV